MVLLGGRLSGNIGPVRPAVIGVTTVLFVFVFVFVSVVAGAAGAAELTQGWKTVSVLRGNASVDVPASWPRGHSLAFNDFWGYLDGRGNLAVNWEPFQGSPAAFKKMIDELQRNGYRGSQAKTTFSRVRIASIPALKYVVTYFRGGFENTDWNYYLMRGGKAYSFSYNCLTSYARALSGEFAKSAQSIAVR